MKCASTELLRNYMWEIRLQKIKSTMKLRMTVRINFDFFVHHRSLRCGFRQCYQQVRKALAAMAVFRCSLHFGLSEEHLMDPSHCLYVCRFLPRN
jgi:hypothetical protein